jgi:CRISPR-associated protein Cas6
MPTIDLAFQLVGSTIPLDHGYSLFSTLCRVVPHLHGDRRIGVHPIRGRQAARGMLSLIEASRLRLRLPSEEVAAYLALAGSSLDLDGQGLRVGIPRVESLNPSASLGARLVTFRHALDPITFEADVRRELDRLGVAGTLGFVPTTRAPYIGQPKRRMVRVKDHRVIGYALRVRGLTAEESLKLQEEGLGGRRRMGCGLFVPITTTA